MVVPLVGTWIEIRLRDNDRKNPQSCPSWARGLKSKGNNPPAAPAVVPLVGTWIEIWALSVAVAISASCPSWARGLKYLVSIHRQELMSCPSWARGLKSGCLSGSCLFRESCPSWARGLKSSIKALGMCTRRRAPRGHVD